MSVTSTVNCILCGAVAEISRYESGTRIGVHCPQCGHYEADHLAASHVQSADFGDQRRKSLHESIANLNARGVAAEIVVDGDVLVPRQKRP